MASVKDLKDEISSLESDIKYRKGGNQNSRRGKNADGLMPLGGIAYLLQRNLSRQDKFKAEGNLAELENEQRIYRNLISEQADQERAIASRETQLASLKQELEAAESAQTQKDSAKGQTASSQVANSATPTSPAVPLTTEEKNNVQNNKSGATAATVNQSQDPKAASQQNTQNNSGPATRSEANFSGEVNAGGKNTSSSVNGVGVTGNSSSFQSQSLEQTPSNKLHNYTSYTYRITLFLLTVKDFNNLSANPSGFTPRYALISSAGGYTKLSSNTDQDTIRHRDFRTDFFIDGLSIETIVGLNAKNKASNAIDISFTITEPYGLSLLDRLLSACEMSEDQNPNYASQPYLLQIDMLASPTDEILLSNKKTDNLIDRKRIAIKIIEMKIKPSATGSTYAIRAMPYNHSAFDTTVAPVPVPLKVEAKTVGDFFANNDDQSQMFVGELKANEERLEAEIDKWIKSNPIVFNQVGRAPTAAEIDQKRKALKNSIIYFSNSYTAAYNKYMDDVVNKAKVATYPPTKISFVMPKEIADSSIVDALVQSSDSRMPDANRGVGTTTDPEFKNKMVFPINAGTNVIEVIDQVLGKSDYIKNQIKLKNKVENDAQAKDEYTNENERAKDNDTAKSLKWYKIIPTVELKEYDKLRNTFSKVITYTIVPYTAVNAYNPNFPKTQGLDVSNKVVREYNYAYTGKNRDILRVDVDFDTAYYTQISTFKNQVARAGTNRFSDPNNISDNLAEVENKSTATIIPQTTEVIGYLAKSNSMNTATNPTEKLVGDLKDSLYTRSRGDNLNIKIQIIGDPDFIKQDDVYYNPRSYEYQQVIGNRGAAPFVKDGPLAGQIIFDSEQVFVRFNVKNAVDINDFTGITNFQEILSNGRSTNGSFSGIYKVLTVKSEFNRGQFTQTLDLIRMPDELPKLVQASSQAVNNESSDYSGRQQKSPAVTNQNDNASPPPGLPGVINTGTRTI